MEDQDGYYGELEEESGGGYYDENGTWISADNEAGDTGDHIEGYYEEAGNWVEVSDNAESALALEGGYYDEWGNWVEPGIVEEEVVEVVDDSDYYDEWGAWVDSTSSNYAAASNETAAATVPPPSGPNTSTGGGGAPAMPGAGSIGGGQSSASSGSLNVEVAFKLKQTALFVACERRDEEAVLALMEAAYAEPGNQAKKTYH